MASLEMKIPSEGVLKHASKIAISDDKPILLDYWADSYGEATVLIGVKENDEKLLVRSSEEYTSPISKIFKVCEEYIVITENSIYIVSTEIPSKRIS
jgi:hypothetical protein|tara:strand:+ start:2614 stop:2904 length:291 start_codon:yes stop_codon:yes gene_type:complete